MTTMDVSTTEIAKTGVSTTDLATLDPCRFCGTKFTSKAVYCIACEKFQTWSESAGFRRVQAFAASLLIPGVLALCGFLLNQKIARQGDDNKALTLQIATVQDIAKEETALVTSQELDPAVATLFAHCNLPAINTDACRESMLKSLNTVDLAIVGIAWKSTSLPLTQETFRAISHLDKIYWKKLRTPLYEAIVGGKGWKESNDAVDRINSCLTKVKCAVLSDATNLRIDFFRSMSTLEATGPVSDLAKRLDVMWNDRECSHLPKDLCNEPE